MTHSIQPFQPQTAPLTFNHTAAQNQLMQPVPNSVYHSAAQYSLPTTQLQQRKYVNHPQRMQPGLQRKPHYVPPDKGISIELDIQKDINIQTIRIMHCGEMILCAISVARLVMLKPNVDTKALSNV